MTVEVLTAALAAYDAGCCTIQPRADGSKGPMAVPNKGKLDKATGRRKAGWELYQSERPSRFTVEGWFSSSPGLGVVCGKVSGQLELFEFEGHAVAEGFGRRFVELVDQAGLRELWDRVTNGYSERTPSGGIHVLLRISDGPAASSMKLAMRPATAEERAADPSARLVTLVETKGEGGFVITAPSNGTTHPNGGAWTMRAGGFDTIATVTVAERDALYGIARELDQCERAESGTIRVDPMGRAAHRAYNGGPVGESWFDAVVEHLAATDTMPDALARYGWRDLGEVDGLGCPLYERPGQIDHVDRPGGLINANGRLVVFSTSTPFVSTLEHDIGKRGPTYDLLDVYAVYEHGGDRKAAARAIAVTTGIYAAWQVGSQPPPNVDPLTGEIKTPTADPPGVRLPDTFWRRPLLEQVRDAAPTIGASAEGLMLTVLAAAGAHVPAAIYLPGRRRWSLNLLACLAGQSGDGKGTTLDRAFELVPAPTGARWYALGSAQGFVKEFFRATTKSERDGDPGLGAWTRHTSPVILRTDEVSAFASAAHKGTDAGDALLADLKQAVSGEHLGRGYVNADKDLRVAPLSYRVVGVLGVAPLEAAPLFADAGGGLPQRLVWAPVLPPGVDGVEDPGEFTPGDPQPENGDTDGKLPALRWRAPRFDRTQRFAFDGRIDEWVNQRRLARRTQVTDPLDAHVDVLRKMIAALLAFLDERTNVTQDDFMLAGDVIAVSVATRTWVLERSTAQKRLSDANRAATRQSEAVNTAAAIEGRRKRDEWILDRARRIAGEVVDQPGVTVGDLRKACKLALRDRWDEALAVAKSEDWVVERDEAGQGGTARRLHPGQERPT